VGHSYENELATLNVSEELLGLNDEQPTLPLPRRVFAHFLTSPRVTKKDLFTPNYRRKENEIKKLAKRSCTADPCILYSGGSV
jgi:hypothetical protein